MKNKLCGGCNIPEGPELRYSRDRLRSFLIIDGFASGEFRNFSGRYANSFPVGFSALTKVDGLVRVLNIDVKGKFMWWELGLDSASQPTWWMHCTYGMSGQWEQRGKKHVTSNDKHVTAYFHYTKNGVKHDLVFVDQRHFGTIKFINDKKAHERKLASLGPDMLATPPSIDEFIKILKKKSELTLPEVLLNQSIISGCGNYVKAEALYRARLSPHRTVSSLTDDEFVSLRQEIILVLNEAYQAKGATIRSYVTPDGNKGDAQFTFNVYGQKQDCIGNVVVREETKDGRTTHWVPSVQR